MPPNKQAGALKTCLGQSHNGIPTANSGPGRSKVVMILNTLSHCPPRHTQKGWDWIATFGSNYAPSRNTEHRIPLSLPFRMFRPRTVRPPPGWQSDPWGWGMRDSPQYDLCVLPGPTQHDRRADFQRAFFETIWFSHFCRYETSAKYGSHTLPSSDFPLSKWFLNMMQGK